MRRCLIGDITTAAAALAAVAAPDRAALAERLIHQAHAAHHYMKRHAKPHPAWGNGSLMARALAAHSPFTPNPASPDLAALAVVLAALTRFRTRFPR
jgi:hypothetical protein